MKHLLKIIILAMGLLFITADIGLCGSETDWAPIIGNQYNMVAYGHVFIAGVDFAPGGFELYSFGPDGDTDCRSKGNIRSDGSYYATILGNKAGEIITFKVYDSNTGEIYELQDTITFQIDETRADFDVQ